MGSDAGRRWGYGAGQGMKRQACMSGRCRTHVEQALCLCMVVSTCNNGCESLCALSIEASRWGVAHGMGCCNGCKLPRQGGFGGSLYALHVSLRRHLPAPTVSRRR